MTTNPYNRPAYPVPSAPPVENYSVFDSGYDNNQYPPTYPQSFPNGNSANPYNPGLHHVSTSYSPKTERTGAIALIFRMTVKLTSSVLMGIGTGVLVMGTYIAGGTTGLLMAINNPAYIGAGLITATLLLGSLKASQITLLIFASAFRDFKSLVFS